MAVSDEKTADTDLIQRSLQRLVDYGVKHRLIEVTDRRWAYNQLLSYLHLTEPGCSAVWENADPKPEEDLQDSLTPLIDTAVANNCVEDSTAGRARAQAGLMGILTPRPSEMNRHFNEFVTEGGPKAATDWFYKLSCDNAYVQRTAIAKNIAWSTDTDWGTIEITINLSKPEKDPRDITAAVKPHTQESYPACQLCMTNEGYAGRSAQDPAGPHPERQNLRIIRIPLGGESWGLQYSPYAYFNEHCIAMSPIHRVMHVDRENMGKLLDFVDLFPHYFIGSNADLPIVGGSILSHDHFQGGAHVFAMMKAEVSKSFSLDQYKDVQFDILKWPMTVIRLTSTNRAHLLDAATHIHEVWKTYSDPSVSIVAQDPDGTRHNTVTPVVRKQGDTYTLYLALRCNITTLDYPLGVFHPHQKLHHIKKENIGLIEVMGLAILPPRLKNELAAVQQTINAYHNDADELKHQLHDNPLTVSHAEWAEKIAQKYDHVTTDIIHKEVSEVFVQVLLDAGVFKWDEQGRSALGRFVGKL